MLLLRWRCSSRGWRPTRARWRGWSLLRSPRCRLRWLLRRATELACTSATTSAPPSTTSSPFKATSPEIDPSTLRSPSPAIRPRTCEPLPRTAAPWDVLLLLALAMGRCPPALGDRSIDALGCHGYRVLLEEHFGGAGSGRCRGRERRARRRSAGEGPRAALHRRGQQMAVQTLRFRLSMKPRIGTRTARLQRRRRDGSMPSLSFPMTSAGRAMCRKSSGDSSPSGSVAMNSCSLGTSRSAAASAFSYEVNVDPLLGAFGDRGGHQEMARSARSRAGAERRTRRTSARPRRRCGDRAARP